MMLNNSPERQEFNDRRLKYGLAWCPVWLMASDIGGGRFLPERPACLGIVAGVVALVPHSMHGIARPARRPP
jgi:hypothetical protein